MREVVFFLFIAFCSINTNGQTDRNKVKINSIKKSSAYIYAEATLESEKEAYDLAQELLYQRINEYIAGVKKLKNAKTTVIINQNYATERLSLPRGNMFRTFLYVKKSDIIPANNANVGMTSNKTVESNTNVSLDNHDITNELLDIETFNEMKQKLAEFKSANKIINYSKYNDLENPEAYVLMIFDNQGKIKAILGEGKQRINLKTKAIDDIRNYKGCGAVGVKIK